MIAGAARGISKLTPLSWCIILSMAANVMTAGMLAWFFVTRPYIRTDGYASIAGTVTVDQASTFNVKIVGR